MKGSGQATEPREMDRFEGGVGWIAHPDEGMERASHALAVDGEVWVVDPVDAEGIDDLLADLGEVAGVVALLDRHERDAEAVARRHDVAVHVPAWMRGVFEDATVPVERFRSELGDTGYELHRVVNNRLWQEGALYHEGSGTLVVAEAVGTAEYYLASSERLGVHPALRLFPPRRLGRFDPERVLVGHGAGILDDAAAALSDALDGARARAPGLYAKTAKEFITG